jgi:hypothetical protein
MPLLKNAVATAWAPLENRGQGSVFVEAGYRLSDAPPTWIQPDVSVLSERASATSGAAYFVRPPELAVEVVSPSETARDLARKVDLAGGSLAGSCRWINDSQTSGCITQDRQYVS